MCYSWARSSRRSRRDDGKPAQRVRDHIALKSGGPESIGPDPRISRCRFAILLFYNHLINGDCAGSIASRKSREQMKRKADEQIEESLSKPGPVRDSAIMRASVVGVIVNFLLAAFKVVVGIVTHSIAITLDAVNNLSDALSSGITIAGTKLASKSPDRKHPYGYGRVEYINAVIVSVIVLYAGITAFSESVERIVHPQTAHYGTVALVIIAVAVLVKILLGRYVKTVGVKVNSNSLIGFGTDSQMDALISASTLLAAFIYIVWGSAWKLGSAPSSPSSSSKQVSASCTRL